MLIVIDIDRLPTPEDQFYFFYNQDGDMFFGRSIYDCKKVVVLPENTKNTQEEQMTNAEKFEKVFGLKPDYPTTPFACLHPLGGCRKCDMSYIDENEHGKFLLCKGRLWWDEEYKGGKDDE